MKEWEARFPQWGEGVEVTLRIADAWKTGSHPVSADDQPRVVIARKPRPKWPDMFMTTGGLLVAREPAMQIIEGLDLGLHQFFPLEIKTKRGLDVEGPWFSMVVSAKQNSILLDQSSIRYSRTSPDTSNNINYHDKRVTVDPSQQSGIHLWREQRFFMSLLGSDTLVAALKEAELKFYPCFKAKDV